VCDWSALDTRARAADRDAYGKDRIGSLHHRTHQGTGLDKVAHGIAQGGCWGKAGLAGFKARMARMPALQARRNHASSTGMPAIGSAMAGTS
jgi:hypothetical protein